MDGPMECRIYVEHGTLGPKFWSLQFSIVKGDETGWRRWRRWPWRRWRRWPWRRYTGGTFNRPNFICFHTHLAHSLFFPLFSIIYSFFLCVCVLFSFWLLVLPYTRHIINWINEMNIRSKCRLLASGLRKLTTKTFARSNFYLFMMQWWFCARKTIVSFDVNSPIHKDVYYSACSV